MDEIPPVAVAVVAVVVVVGAVPALAVVGPALATPTDAPTDGGTAAADPGNASLAPGERLAGVVGVQRAELDGEVAARAFGRQVAGAASNGSKARIVGATVENISERLAALAEAKADLRAAHENGSIGTGQYRSQLAQLHARQRTLQRLANETEAVAAGLPDATLEANGVNVTAIRTLRTEARNLTGPETAAVARSIAGRGVGNGVGPPADRGPNANRGPDGERGPPDDRGPNADGNETDDDPDGNETDGDRGPPEDRGPNANDDDGNETDDNRGPPDDRGPPENESESESESESEGEPEDDSADARDGNAATWTDDAGAARLLAVRAA